MINIENLHFFRKEVLVTKPKQDNGLLEGANPFADAPKTEDKTSYILVEVIKIGEKQDEVKVGEKYFVSEQFLSTIPIKNQGILEDVYKLINANPLLAKYVEPQK
jgi:hypothetical protein